MRNLKLTVEYKGTDYVGFQKQPDRKSIQGVLEETLSKILQEDIALIGAGRTDAGVHAKGQCVNLLISSKMDCGRLKRSTNSLLPSDIVIKEMTEVDPSFHARRNARSREYKYLILNREYPSAFWNDFSFFLREPLDLAAIQEAAAVLEGEHDFSSFCVSESKPENGTRSMERVGISRERDLIHLDFEANAFLHNMVRIIVGTLIQVGSGTLSAERMQSILAAGDRKEAGPTVPPHGLFLMRVNY
jgi:tRNA pseudouridine38-40 synthase